MTTIVLKTFNSAIEANLVKGMLESNGIKCFLNNENFSTLMPQFNGMMGAGVQLVIDESDAEKALTLLPETQNEVIVCPNCKSQNIGFGLGKKKRRKIVAILLSLFAGVPFGNIRNKYYCKDCSTEFTR